MQESLKLDVVVPTYNRSHLLSLALDSLLRAPVPPGLEVCLYVADNNSTDDTRALVEAKRQTASLPIVYVPASVQGCSAAKNAGILAGSGDIVAFIDDDEEIDSEWYRVLLREFAAPDILFIGGPYLPNWICAAPGWMPAGYNAVIGAVPPKPRAVIDDSFGGNLMGGNCALRRSVFERVGLYDPRLGRSAKGLLSDEDAEFFGRVRRAGLKGLYVPDLAIHHYIAPERLTKRYYRRWVYWRAVSLGSQARGAPEPVPQLGGVPRYRIGRALRGLVDYPRLRWIKRSAGEAFSGVLAICELAGFIYGRHFARMESFYREKKT